MTGVGNQYLTGVGIEPDISIVATKVSDHCTTLPCPSFLFHGSARLWIFFANKFFCFFPWYFIVRNDNMHLPMTFFILSVLFTQTFYVSIFLIAVYSVGGTKLFLRQKFFLKNTGFSFQKYTFVLIFFLNSLNHLHYQMFWFCPI